MRNKIIKIANEIIKLNHMQYPEQEKCTTLAEAITVIISDSDDEINSDEVYDYIVDIINN